MQMDRQFDQPSPPLPTKKIPGRKILPDISCREKIVYQQEKYHPYARRQISPAICIVT
jgi:hypothetical protein